MAFVTGGANGVGIGIVRALLAEGAKVCIADIRQDAIDAALNIARQPRSHGRVQVNVADRAAMADARAKVEAEFGVVTLLFNNAGHQSVPKH